MSFIPTSVKEIKALGWDSIDIILFSGDAYVDHPSFGAAVIARTLEAGGYRVALIPQPNWQDDLRDFKKLGQPRLFFGVTAGNMDSMVNHYTANRRLRSNDAYTPDGKAGFRPDYACTVYTRILKTLYPKTPVVLGGIEASLRRLCHYDYWADQLKPSILIESQADMLVYGMGEKTILALAEAFDQGRDWRDLPQIAYVTDPTDKKFTDAQQTLRLHSYEACLGDQRKYGENFKLFEVESNKMLPRTLLEPYGTQCVCVNPTVLWESRDLDASYALPYTRLPHPRYKNKPIPAYEMIKFSVNIHRGCFGGCSFCTISAHQGKFIVSRSESSILKEVKTLTGMEDFKGHLSDLGGPSANMYRMHGKDLQLCRACLRPSCLFPSPCINLNDNIPQMLSLYSKVRKLTGVKKVTIGSGIRYDQFMNAKGFSGPNAREYFETLLRHHVSGRLKVAPEHTEERVVRSMRKPNYQLFEKFKAEFDRFNRQAELRQQLIPYFISCHPICTEQDMRLLEKKTRDQGFQLEQVQEFTPTPMTLSTCMYYTGENPYTLEKVYVAKDKTSRSKQHLQFFSYKQPSLHGKPTAVFSSKKDSPAAKNRTSENRMGSARNDSPGFRKVQAPKHTRPSSIKKKRYD